MVRPSSEIVRDELSKLVNTVLEVAATRVEEMSNRIDYDVITCYHAAQAIRGLKLEITEERSRERGGSGGMITGPTET